MIDLSNAQHHHAIEALVDVLCAKTDNDDRGFFRVEVAYFFAKMAASMRASVSTLDRGVIPVNIYAVALGTSGYGKGYSVSVVENEFLSGFQRRFMEDTFKVVSDQHLWTLASKRAAMSGKPEEDERKALDREFSAAGNIVFSFDSGTTPAVKQLREKLLLANIGSINLQIDEIGSNLMTNTEVLTAYLELYDQGQIKQKLIKNTQDNQRGEEITGKTPTNALLFGTPANLLDSGMTEDAFQEFLQIGYARRSFFAWGTKKKASDKLTPEQLFDRLANAQNSSTNSKWANHFTSLADSSNYGREINLNRAEGIELIRYKIACETAADALPEHDEVRKAEMSHRYFKALKLAGALAFVDGTDDITINQLLSAILLTEESGAAFEQMMNREKRHVKLAKYIANIDGEVTHADLYERFLFYKASASVRSELLTLAASWGYKNHTIIRKRFQDGIEFFSGETLQKTSLDALSLSWSSDWTYGYASEKPSWYQLPTLTQAKDLHWCNHSFVDGHRLDENAIPGFNLIVLDVDGTAPMQLVHEMLADYCFMTYTTKRHTDQDNRFRLILPINYTLQLDQEDYREFMNGVMEWMPFTSDSGANQRARKWMTCDTGTYFQNEGELFDALPFIPRTSRNEEHRGKMGELQSLDNLERWFAGRMEQGNRNNHMIKFALALADSGMSYLEVENAVLGFNSKLANGLSPEEIRSTILVTAAKHINKKP